MPTLLRWRAARGWRICVSPVCTSKCCALAHCRLACFDVLSVCTAYGRRTPPLRSHVACARCSPALSMCGAQARCNALAQPALVQVRCARELHTGRALEVSMLCLILIIACWVQVTSLLHSRSPCFIMSSCSAPSVACTRVADAKHSYVAEVRARITSGRGTDFARSTANVCV